MLAALNDGTAADDPNGFLLTKENGGWPLLRWELTQPQAPDTELDSKKEALKSQLAEVWSQYREASYEPENWAALTKLYNDALAAIAAARTAEELPLLSELMTDMAFGCPCPWRAVSSWTRPVKRWNSSRPPPWRR